MNSKGHYCPTRLRLAFLMCVVCAMVPRLNAQTTAFENIVYQGFLTDADGTPLGDPAQPLNYRVQFRLYDSSDTLVWAEEQVVTVDQGYFSVLLGQGSQVDSEPRPDLETLLTGPTPPLKLGITVPEVSTDPNNPEEISPRLSLQAAPYAFRAHRAEGIADASGHSFVTTNAGKLVVDGALQVTDLTVTGTISGAGNDKVVLSDEGADSTVALGQSGAQMYFRTVKANGEFLWVRGGRHNGTPAGIAEIVMHYKGSGEESGLTVTGAVDATSFSGDGSGLTNLPAPTGFADLSGDNIFTGENQFGSVVATSFSGDGSNLTNLPNTFNGLQSSAGIAVTGGGVSINGGGQLFVNVNERILKYRDQIILHRDSPDDRFAIGMDSDDASPFVGEYMVFRAGRGVAEKTGFRWFIGGSDDREDHDQTLAGQLAMALTKKDGADNPSLAVSANTEISGALLVSGKTQLDGGLNLDFDSINEGPANYELWLNNQGVVVRGASSKRYKKNIGPMQTDWDAVFDLTPVRFQYKSAADGVWSFGYIAEEIDEAGVRDLVVYDAEGRPDNVRYNLIPIYLLEVVRKNRGMINELEAEAAAASELARERAARIEELESVVSAQGRRMEALEARVAEMTEALGALLASKDGVEGPSEVSGSR